MALGDNDGALVCRTGPSEIRSLFVLRERGAMGQFTTSIGHEILRFKVTVISPGWTKWWITVSQVCSTQNYVCVYIYIYIYMYVNVFALQM